MPSKLKRGRLGKPEASFIKDNVGKLSPEEIAAQLNRDPEMVRTWIKENLAVDVKGDELIPLEETEIRNELRESSDWEQLREQFVEAELKIFERRYSELMKQFRNDVLATEKMQIFHLIKLDILMDRNLKSRSRALQDIDRLETDIADFYDEHKDHKLDDNERNQVLNMENQLIAAREAEASKTNEYVKLSEKHSKLMEQLKATRDQRITKWENSKQTFVGLLKAMQDADMRDREGEDLKLMQLATENEIKRLSKSHQYVDDNYDQPLLTPETVGAEDDSDIQDRGQPASDESSD